MERSKKRFLVPNLLTAINLLLGFLSIVFALEGHFLSAAWTIIGAGIMDCLDGKVARRLKACSNFGQQFDSFADSISFGLAPAIFIYLLLIGANYSRITVILLTFLYLLGGILRLVRFNLTADLTNKKKGTFSGLPIPAGAGLLVSYYIFIIAIWGELVAVNLFLGFIVAATISMVSNIKYYNFFQLIVKAEYKMIIGLILLFFSNYLLFPAFLLYLLVNSFRAVKEQLEKGTKFFVILIDNENHY